MATPGNRSPSPIATRPNPNSRTPEANSTTRRSYSGNPFAKPSLLSNPRIFPPPVAPANSPASDLGGRSSISKEAGCFSRVFDEKENEKDQNFKPVKLRSPAMVKGTKNFMAPTISAASKINPSPKKKVLGERNESVRTSISFSDGNSLFGSLNISALKEDVDSKEETKDSTITKVESFESQFMSESYSNVESDMGLGQNINNKAEDPNSSAIRKSKKVSFADSPVPLTSESFSESVFDMNPLESDITSAGNEGKIKPLGSATSPLIAPLDADPSRPYDPKTNYLSPRPQFLHYKPNPRIEVYLQKEKRIGDSGSTEQGKRLEESFISESFSDTEVTSEEIESETSNKESEDDSSTEAVNGEVEPLAPEPKPNTLPFTTLIDKETLEEKSVLKPRFFTRSRFAALILVLLIGCISVSVKESPQVLDFSVYKDLSISKFYDLSEIAELSKARFVDGFARNLKQWSANSVVYLIELVSSLDEVEKLGPVQFSNLTSLLEDPFVDGYLKLDHIKEGIHEQEVEVEEEIIEEDLENGAADEEADNGEEALGLDIEEEDLALLTEVVESDSSELVLDQEPSDIPSLPSHDPETRPDVGEILEIKPEIVDIGEPRPDVGEILEIKPEIVVIGEPRLDVGEIVDAGEVQGEVIESAKVEANPQSHLEMSTSLEDVSTSVSVNGSENKLLVHYIRTVSLPASALVAAIAIAAVYLKQRRTPTSPGAAVDLCQTKKLRTSTPQSHIWPADVDVDVVEESCPSEMSSFQNSMSYSKKGALRGENETQIQEMKQQKVSKRRESLASSSDYSMGSPSYGSFTTYEKIPVKHGSGEEEIVTPVRRSSRFRSQVMSP